ncbi:C2H2-type zinc finger transcription factor [Mucor lusitanicus CBS 277.49]|uniref:C2H2-type zinc finger transcription factor n=1 Tax=Mucor lusitanicus CBS 277.49 TaxID=747725 RepID=A0A162ZVP5_MUCCL|nr:C2H2-type zinc finger transcription factor [Mucor lusitanicus CBS 277.49]
MEHLFLLLIIISLNRLQNGTHETNAAKTGLRRIFPGRDVDVLDEEEDEDKDVQENAVGLFAADADGFEEQDQRQVPDNHLPFQFCNNPGTILFYYFIGLYTGDGYHNAANNLIGFKFKSTSFAYLYQLLASCGVPQPQLQFVNKANQPSTRYNAGNIGIVHWGYQSTASAAALFRYGLPSSSILDSDPALRAQFLPQENRLEVLLAFMLGYFSADGSIPTRWGGAPDNILITYQGIYLYARDDYLLVWLRVVQGNHFNILAYLTNDLNDAQLLHGLQVLTDSGVMLDGKLSLLLRLLQNEKRAPASVSSPHQTGFHEYLGACYDPDRVACVVGQDLFDANLFELNIICDFIGFPVFGDIYDFVQELRDISNNPLVTPGQQLAAAYLRNCEQRVIPNAEIINKRYRPPFFRCEINGCGKHFFRRYEFLNHVQAKHALIPFVCPVEGCGEEFAFPSGLVTHRRLVHGSENTQPVIMH